MRAVAPIGLLGLVVVASTACAGEDARADGRERTATDGEQAGATSNVPLRLVVLGDLEGVAEPCGCGSRPAGGIDRVAAAIARLRRGVQRTLVLAAGDSLFAAECARGRHPRLQDEWKADLVGAVLPRLGLDAMTPGPADLVCGAARLPELSRSGAVRLVSLGIVAPHIESLSAGLLLNAGSAQVGITAAIDPPAGRSERLRVAADSLAGIRDESARLRKRGAAIVIAAIHGGVRAADRLVAQADVDIVVQTGLRDSTPGVTPIGERALLVSAGRHGEGLVSLDLWPAEGRSRRWRLLRAPPPIALQAIHAGVGRYVVLDASASRDAAVRARLAQLFARINAHNAAAEPVQAAASGADRNRIDYVGSETCAACHTQAFFWWRGTSHGRAFDTLVARGRQYDLDCIGCHVTGHDALGANPGVIAQRKGVGCESCHGPGGAHVENPRPPHRGIQREVPPERCLACHDRDHSAEFRHAARRLELLVPGHGGDRAGR